MKPVAEYFQSSGNNVARLNLIEELEKEMMNGKMKGNFMKAY